MNKVILNIILIIALMVAGYIIGNKVFDKNEDTIEQIVKTDTLRIYETIIDTVFYSIKDTIIIPADTVFVTEKDTLANFRWFPNKDYLKGFLDITYSYQRRDFRIINNLEVLERIKTVKERVTETKLVTGNTFRPIVSAGFYGSKDEGIFKLGFGILIKNSFEISAEGLSNKMLGINFSYKMNRKEVN